MLVAARGDARYRDDDADAALEWFAAHSGLDMSRARGGHELDAVLSAWATRKGTSEGWHDLVTGDPVLIFPAGPVSYLWPELLVAKLATSAGPVVRKTAIAGGRRTGPAGASTAVGYLTETSREWYERPACRALIMVNPSMSYAALSAATNMGQTGPKFFSGGAHDTEVGSRDCPTTQRTARDDHTLSVDVSTDRR